MNTPALLAALLAPIALIASQALGQEADSKSTSPVRLPMPPGMARADDAKQVAALYSETHQKRVEAIEKKAPQEERLTAAEEYSLMLIAYRTQLVQEQLERKRREQELQLEREARLTAELRAAELERERSRESIYIQHHSVHAYQRSLNDEYWREQRLLRLLNQQHHHHQPCPTPTPAPAPAPTPQMTTSTGTSEETGDTLP